SLRWLSGRPRRRARGPDGVPWPHRAADTTGEHARWRRRPPAAARAAPAWHDRPAGANRVRNHEFRSYPSTDLAGYPGAGDLRVVAGETFVPRCPAQRRRERNGPASLPAGRQTPARTAGGAVLPPAWRGAEPEWPAHGRRRPAPL